MMITIFLAYETNFILYSLAYNSNDDNDKSQMTDTASLTHGSNTSSQSTPPADSADTYRWVNQLSDSDEECHRLETYKLKRRERYQAAARRAIAAAAASCNTGGFLARINVRDRQPLRMPSIYATNSNISVPLYRNTVGSMTKLTTITC